MNDEIRALAHVQKEIAKSREDYHAALSADRVSSFEEYKKICGVIQGLNLADSIINDLVHRLEKE